MAKATSLGWVEEPEENWTVSLGVLRNPSEASSAKTPEPKPEPKDDSLSLGSLLKRKA